MVTPASGVSIPLACPFVAGPMITDPSLFVGRKDELQAITTRMTGIQPISVNFVGERRIGKSSLLYHFFQTWEQLINNNDRYVVSYLSLQRAGCQTKSSFYQAIAHELLSRPLVRRRTDLSTTLNLRSFDSWNFADALDQWLQYRVLPVLCIDEFEVLLRYPDEFDDEFYDHLRSLMDKNAIMLVITSLRPLDVYREEQRLTSSFFNLGQVLYLGELTEEEAEELVRLPASNLPGATPALSIQEQRQAREWGGKHPYLLQLAASAICEARQQRKTLTWARRQFENEQRRLFEPASPVLYWSAPIRLVVWSFPIRIGRLSRYVSKNFSVFKSWITGVVVIVLLVLIIVGVLTTPQIIAWFKAIFGG